jgi:hypothetical protein
VDLTRWLLRRMPVRPLVVATPGGTAARLGVERIARERGWRMALSPAEANLLVLAGPTGAGWAPFVDAVWNSVPVPRARAQITTAAHVEESLMAAVAELTDPDRQRSEAIRLAETPGQPEHGQESHGMHGHDLHGHGGHEHHMGGMELPGGVGMADRAADRDGLMLDRLAVPLGPVLPDWPAGLVVRTVLQGDVVQDASVEVLRAGTGQEYWRGQGVEEARRLDRCARLLAVAGWEHAATRARVLRDAVLLGRSDQQAMERWARRIRRSRVLRWSLTGLGVLSGAQWDDTPYAGDVYDRLLRWLDGAAEEPSIAGAVLEVLPEVLAGSELAGARLVIASLDPDTEVPAGAVAAHG